MSLYINEGYRNTFNEYIKMMELTLTLISDAKQNKLDENELKILSSLINEVLYFGLSEEDLTLRSPKRRKVFKYHSCYPYKCKKI